MKAFTHSDITAKITVRVRVCLNQLNILKLQTKAFLKHAIDLNVNRKSSAQTHFNSPCLPDTVYVFIL